MSAWTCPDCEPKRAAGLVACSECCGWRAIESVPEQSPEPASVGFWNRIARFWNAA